MMFFLRSKLQLSLALLIVCFLVESSAAKFDRCYFDGTHSASTTNELDKECTSSEYSSYVDCIRKRSKRHIDCINECEDEDNCGNDNCGQCDCNYCSYNDCESNCESCCQGYAPPCSTRTCCHATCQSTCRTSSCRRGCRARCHKSIETIKITSNSSSTNNALSVTHDAKSSNQVKHNITTVINLKTVVNNTNIVDMPIRLNNTNLNNITLESSKPGDINVNMQHQEPPAAINHVQYPLNLQQPLQLPQYPMQIPHQLNQDEQLPQLPQVPIQSPQNPLQSPPQYPTEAIDPQFLQYPQLPNFPQYLQHPDLSQGPCCSIISPRQCTPIAKPPYQHCFHTKTKVCGEICTSAVMHAEPHRVCDQADEGRQQASCHEQVAYIPQPQPRCFSTSKWPYVNCMVAKPTCGGCYTHLINGGTAPSNCPNSCYQDGINVGPFYRPGPLYQPSYQMYPSLCGAGGCYPQVPEIGGDMNSWQMQSIGPWFNQRPSNMSFVDDNNFPSGVYKRKRHSHKKGKALHESELDIKIEEYPIKME